MAIEQVAPGRCTLWQFHERFGDELSDETCKELITSMECHGQRHPALGRRLGRTQRWVADFTYIWTHEGWVYFAVVLDLFSRRIVGWAMSSEMTAQLVTDALVMAVWRRGRPKELLHHSDQGSQPGLNWSSQQLVRV